MANVFEAYEAKQKAEWEAYPEAKRFGILQVSKTKYAVIEQSGELYSGITGMRLRRFRIVENRLSWDGALQAVKRLELGN